MRHSAVATALFVGLLGPQLAAQDRSLRWPALEVAAHLEADGRLRLLERQTILLTGDWNGPERLFDVPWGQSLALHGITRFNRVTRTESPLRAGDLSAVDEFRWGDGYQLRWRSRLPSDPPFAGDTLVYTLDLSYGFILQPVAKDSTAFLLNHNFAFTDRWEEIERVTVTLTLDDAWSAPPGFTGRYAGGPLAPGEGFVVAVPLRHVGIGMPASVVRGAPSSQRRLIAGALLAIALILALRLLFIERAIGRFASVIEPEAVTRQFLDEHVLRLAPEVAGTAWDDTTAAPEVAATLARLMAADKLSSRVEEKAVWKFKRQVLHLELLVAREHLSKHDRKLIDALFSPGRGKTNTDEVRARYRSTGFDPAALITTGVRQQLDAAEGLGGIIPAPSRIPALLLFVAGLALCILGLTRSALDLPFAAAGIGIAAVSYLFLALQAKLWGLRVVNPFVHLTLRILLPGGVLIAILARAITEGASRTSVFALAGVACLSLACWQSVLNVARSRHDATRIAARKRLAAAREFFKRELMRPTPNLDDAWFPWVLGFGLGPVADRWFKAFAAPSIDPRSTSRHGGFGGSGESSGGGWTGFGGGGGFSGAGSSASFAAAVGGMAASVPAPSSSSSGGGGGGGGGSSGGGGGGGW